MNSELADELSKFPSYLHKHLRNLCSRGRIGLSKINTQDITPVAYSDGWDDVDNNTFYHFLMKIPYAGKILKWEVLFDPENLNFAPDFLFDEEHFPSNVDIDFIEEHLPSLNRWDLNDEDALSRILREFLVLYKMEHTSRLKSEKSFQRYYNDFQRLIESENGIPKENIEVFINYASTPVTLTFLILLKLDFSSLPDYEQTQKFPMDPGPDFAHLKIVIQSEVLRGTFPKEVSLQLSPRLRQCLGKFEEFPKFSEEVSLDEYILEVTNCVENRIELVKRCHVIKNEFGTHFVALCNHSLMEYDSEKFQYITFLLGSDNKYVVKVHIEPNFPLERPTVTILSATCVYPKCISKIFLRNFPLKSTEKKPEEIARLLMKDIVDGVRQHVPHNHPLDEPLEFSISDDSFNDSG